MREFCLSCTAKCCHPNFSWPFRSKNPGVAILVVLEAEEWHYHQNATQREWPSHFLSSVVVICETWAFSNLWCPVSSSHLQFLSCHEVISPKFRVLISLAAELVTRLCIGHDRNFRKTCPFCVCSCPPSAALQTWCRQRAREYALLTNPWPASVSFNKMR